MGDIDEISKLLGVLEGTSQETRHQLKVLFSHHEKQSAILQQISSNQSTILTRLDEMKPHVNDYKRFKRMVITVAAFVGLGSGIGSTGLLDYLRSILPFWK